MKPSMLPVTIPLIAAPFSFGAGCTKASLPPIVELRQFRKVLSIEDGSGVWERMEGAEELDVGAFEGRAMVLLYPSRERAKDDAR